MVSVARGCAGGTSTTARWQLLPLLGGQSPPATHVARAAAVSVRRWTDYVRAQMERRQLRG
eukprot:6185370-Karenia_brevis.AAC.1